LWQKTLRRALLLLREQLHYRRDRFAAGLQAAGFKVCQTIPDPRPGDVVITWNRYAHWDAECRRFEKAWASVLIAENSYLAGHIPGKWHALALHHHAGRGTWKVGGPERWDALGVKLAPWRTGGTETVILAQRSIGEPGIASPRGWEAEMQRKTGGRIRPHPHRNPSPVPLEDDLRNAACVVTWGSSAALVALMMGVPVCSMLPGWIGEHACRIGLGAPKRDDTARLQMFQRLIWAQSTVQEIESGEAFSRLLS
jgi:hypothetical protein